MKVGRTLQLQILLNDSHVERVDFFGSPGVPSRQHTGGMLVPVQPMARPEISDKRERGTSPHHLWIECGGRRLGRAGLCEHQK